MSATLWAELSIHTLQLLTCQCLRFPCLSCSVLCILFRFLYLRYSLTHVLLYHWKWLRRFENWLRMVLLSVVLVTVTRQHGAFWMLFAKERFPPLDLYLWRQTHRESVITVLDPILWLSDDGKRQGAVRTIISGVKFYFKWNIISSDVLGGPSIKSALIGLGSLEASSKSLQWALPLNTHAWARLWMSSHLDYKMTYIAGAVGYNFSLRIGEIAKSASYNKPPKFPKDHRFYFCDIELEDENDPSIMYSFSKYKSISPRPIIYVIILLITLPRPLAELVLTGNFIF